MSDPAIVFAPATELARALRERELSAREVLDAHLAQIERVNPSVNAVATIIIAVVAIGVVIASFLIARNERRRATDAAAAQRPNPA